MEKIVLTTPPQETTRAEREIDGASDNVMPVDVYAAIHKADASYCVRAFRHFQRQVPDPLPSEEEHTFVLGYN